ncbi:MAG: hypothetical protein IPJ58_05095 [Ardenticatenia bacterium]|nr:hypothetical protein [Ardenticatenia bacterium]
MALFIIPGLYGTIMGFLILGRLRIAWVLLMIGRTLGLAIQLMALSVGSVSAMAQRLNGAAGTDILERQLLRRGLFRARPDLPVGPQELVLPLTAAARCPFSPNRTSTPTACASATADPRPLPLSSALWCD